MEAFKCLINQMYDFNVIHNWIYNGFIIQSIKKINSFLRSAKLSYHNAGVAAEYCEPPPAQRFGPFLNWLLSKQEDAKSSFFLQNQARIIQTYKRVIENSFLAMFISQVSSKLRDKHCQITRISILIFKHCFMGQYIELVIILPYSVLQSVSQWNLIITRLDS